jgi:hypothetical protein
MRRSTQQTKILTQGKITGSKESFQTADLILFLHPNPNQIFVQQSINKFHSMNDDDDDDDDAGRNLLAPPTSLLKGAKNDEAQNAGWRLLLFQFLLFSVVILLVVVTTMPLDTSTGSTTWLPPKTTSMPNVRPSSVTTPCGSSSSIPTLKELQSYLHFAYAAFCPDDDLWNWTCEWCHQEELPANTIREQLYFHVTAIVYNDTTKTRGFVGFLPSQQLLVASFRGSDAGANWILDLTPGTSRDFYNVTVHKGWVEAYRALRGQLWKGLEAAHVQCPKCRSFVTTGHSLGAAIRYEYYQENEPIHDL